MIPLLFTLVLVVDFGLKLPTDVEPFSFLACSGSVGFFSFIGDLFWPLANSRSLLRYRRAPVAGAITGLNV